LKPCKYLGGWKAGPGLATPRDSGLKEAQIWPPKSVINDDLMIINDDFCSDFLGRK
jgi:hypothetical protein